MKIGVVCGTSSLNEIYLRLVKKKNLQNIYIEMSIDNDISRKIFSNHITFNVNLIYYLTFIKFPLLHILFVVLNIFVLNLSIYKNIIFGFYKSFFESRL
jgi:hypothetical protein